MFTLLAVAATSLIIWILVAVIVMIIVHLVLQHFPIPQLIKTIVYIIMLLIFLMVLLEKLGYTG